ncbi:MAG: stage II sporulation protein D [Moorellales bacterium]
MPRFLWGWLALLLAGVILLPLLVVTLLSGPRLPQITTDRAVRLYLPATGSLEVLPLEEYVRGVVAAEMPARFAPEALKAQAVAARTYAVRRLVQSRQGAGTHPEADVCNDPKHCQGWLSEAEMRQRWGWLGYWFFRRKVTGAVLATRGLVLTYQGELIDPVYHSASGGRTEDPREIWGRSVPYLRSQPSPWEEESPYNEVVTVLSAAEVRRRLGLAATSGADLSLRVASYTASGRIKTVVAAGRLFTGPEFRQLLGLNSTWFRWEKKGQDFVFYSRGYGHGVGMSQYGAQGLARRGKSFREILAYYYPGTRLVSLSELRLP